MSITPRKSEIESVVNILDSDAFDSPDQMARELIKTVARMVSERDSFGLAVGLPGEQPWLAHGPYWSRNSAQKALKEAEGAGLRGYIAPLFSAEWMMREQAVKDDSCATCGHAKWQHWDRGACALYHRSFTGERARTRPNLPKCPCKGYEKKG